MECCPPFAFHSSCAAYYTGSIPLLPQHRMFSGEFFPEVLSAVSAGSAQDPVFLDFSPHDSPALALHSREAQAWIRIKTGEEES